MERDRKQSVQAGAARLLPRLLAMLEQVCRPDSGTGCEEGNRQVIDALRPLFEELGAQVEEIYEPGLGTHVVARLYPEGKPEGRMLLMGHLDTVFPLGSAEKHPFHIDGDWAWGLGAGDCKSGVLIALFAGLLLKQEGLLPPWELTYVLNCDEEIGSPSGQKLFAREARGADCALVFEGGREADGKIRLVTARRGVILGDIQVTGREAHAGKAYLEGRSAVLELAHQIIRLYGFNDPERGIYYNVAPISGGRPNGVVAGEAAGQFCVAGLPTNEDFAGVEAKLRSMEKQVTVDGCYGAGDMAYAVSGHGTLGRQRPAVSLRGGGRADTGAGTGGSIRSQRHGRHMDFHPWRAGAGRAGRHGRGNPHHGGACVCFLHWGETGPCGIDHRGGLPGLSALKKKIGGPGKVAPGRRIFLRALHLPETA